MFKFDFMIKCDMYILKSDIRFHFNAHQNIYHWRKYYTETSFNMDFKKIYLKKKKSNFNCAKLFKIAKYNLLHC